MKVEGEELKKWLKQVKTSNYPQQMASDARSILGVKDAAASKPSNPLEEAMGGSSAPKPTTISKPPLGVSREVFNLLKQQQPGDTVSTGDLSR